MEISLLAALWEALTTVTSRRGVLAGHGGDTCDGQPFRSEANTDPFAPIGNATGLDFIFTTSVRF